MTFSEAPSKKLLPWKYYVLEAFIRCLRLQSLTTLLLVIFWGTCGGGLAEILQRPWGIAGFCGGFLLGLFSSSFLTWIIYRVRGRGQRYK